MTPIQASFDKAGRLMIDTPVVIPEPEPAAYGSLWRPGSKQFFKDSRAHEVGDIVTVVVSEVSEAVIEAETETSAVHNTASGITNLLNLEGKLTDRGIAPGVNSLIDTDSDRSFKGKGDTDRKDTLSASIAAVVTQVLPNGYLVIQGKREVVVNYELKELMIQGIVRPEDISATNTIASAKIAEARVFYAGRGLVDESQTPSYGVRFLDKVLPF
jgi:flagellar L-ring protein precursor FlgH